MHPHATANVRRPFHHGGVLAGPLFIVLLAACGSSEVATGKIADPRGSNGDASVGSGGTRTGSGGSAGDGGTGGFRAMGGASGASTGGASGSGGRSTGGTPSDSGVGGDAGGTTADASPPPTEVPSAQTVTFKVTNASGADRYVVTGGNNCTSLELDKLADGGQSIVPLMIGFQCPCECPMPGSARPTAFRRVAAGESFDVTWDARGLTTWRQSIVCQNGGPFPPRASSVVAGVLQPVDAGRYRITLGVESTLPAGCQGSGPDYRCDVSYASNETSEIAPRCLTSSNAATEFSLPVSGDVVVSFVLN
jgi:hypothetical protein